MFRPSVRLQGKRGLMRVTDDGSKPGCGAKEPKIEMAHDAQYIDIPERLAASRGRWLSRKTAKNRPNQPESPEIRGKQARETLWLLVV